MTSPLQIFRLLLLLGLFLYSPVLFAQQDDRREGFLFRFLLGPGSASMEFNDPEAPRVGEEGDRRTPLSLETDSNSFYAALQVGRSATEDFIVHINSFYSYNPERKFKSSDPSAPIPLPGNGSIMQSSRSFGFSVGFSYYFPWNMYISPEYRSAVFTRIEHRVQVEGNADASYSYQIGDLEGDGFGISLGQEFWLSPELSMGFALIYHSDTLHIREFQERNLQGAANMPYREFSQGQLVRRVSSQKQSFMGLLLSITYN